MICYRCKEDKPKEAFSRVAYHLNVRGYNSWCRDCKNLGSKESKRRIRAKVMAMYGNKCECCGEDQDEFLSIDHINGRKLCELEERGIELYRILAKENKRRLDLRILCHNCNLSRGLYGYCPHKRVTEDAQHDRQPS